jgi:diguanylate cyclase (GGDEF)-like protein/PAS domain S-box-containing protein
MAVPSASVVLVEDSPPYARLVQRLLADALPAGVEVRHHERLQAAAADLRERDADVVLLGLGVPDAHGLEGLAVLLSDGVRAPIVVLSEHDDDEQAVAAIRTGAQDYLVKGSEREAPAFARAIRFAIERSRAQERSEDLLRAKEDRWRTLTHLAPVGIAETDAGGRCVFVNDWVVELTGRAHERLAGLGWRDGLHPGDGAGFDAAWRAARDGAGEFSREVRFVGAGGEVRWVHLTAVLLRDPWDGPAGWLSTLIDVTPARRAREELHAAEQELRRRQEDVLAVTALAREASVAPDPVPLLCAGARDVLGAQDAELLPAGAGLDGDGVREPVVRGDEALGVLRVRFAPGAAAPGPRVTTVVQLVAAELGAALQRRRLLEQLRDLARTDPLTGLANRRLWDERLEVELARAGRNGRALCVAALDLDRFKSYNDRHGHQAGDRLLRETATGWQGVLRASDLLARQGGDEFAVLLPDCDLDGARATLERLQALTDPEIGCSAGLVRWSPPEPGAALLARADSALYAAKGEGRGGIRVA